MERNGIPEVKGTNELAKGLFLFFSTLIANGCGMFLNFVQMRFLGDYWFLSNSYNCQKFLNRNKGEHGTILSQGLNLFIIYGFDNYGNSNTESREKFILVPKCLYFQCKNSLTSGFKNEKMCFLWFH